MTSSSNRVLYYSYLRGVGMEEEQGSQNKPAAEASPAKGAVAKSKGAVAKPKGGIETWYAPVLYYSYLRGVLPDESAQASTPAEQKGNNAPAEKKDKKDKKDKKEGGGKDAREEKKRQRRLERGGGAAASVADSRIESINAADFGTLPLNQSQVEITHRKFLNVSEVNRGRSEQHVWIRARLQASRGKGKAAFLILRQQAYTLQCALFVGETVTKDMIKYATSITKESIVEVYGKICVVPKPIESCSQQDVELAVCRIYTVSAASPDLPFELADAARSETEFADESAKYVRVSQEVRLDNRWVDLRTPANNAIFRVQSAVCQLFREYLYTQGFFEIHTPKIISAASEGGANVFKLNYFGGNAFLAQSPQLYKQMAICGDFERVFEIGPVFRAENSQTHRHMTEFTGLDLEMAFRESYMEVVDTIDNMFTSIFDGLNTRFAKELELVNAQFPFEPLVYTKPSLRLTYPQAVSMLRGAGVEIGDHEDLGTVEEKLLGKLVKEKYNTDFFILLRYPTCARPFYTMPCPDDPTYTNSYDMFIRGEEITSGSQRIHDYALLEKRAKECEVSLPTVRAYMDSFKHGCPPHGGCGIGLERVVMLFLNIHNIRRASMFPRDPMRVVP